ncbi:MAG TPA: cytochrome c [Stellaceae bacterium]|jgi:methanol metabolism-related c-type cytochrome|nr:cytochrome c [Stellaceae bacterium]
MKLRYVIATWFPVFVSAAGILAASFTLAAESGQPTQKPYTIQNGKVDKKTYNGWRRYTESCMRCHGPDGAGSSYAPDLVDSAKHMTQDQFNEIVVNGKTDVNTASENVMPPFGTVEDVMNYLDDIWAYLKARADGALGRGRPPRIGD